MPNNPEDQKKKEDAILSRGPMFYGMTKEQVKENSEKLREGMILIVGEDPGPEQEKGWKKVDEVFRAAIDSSLNSCVMPGGGAWPKEIRDFLCDNSSNLLRRALELWNAIP